MVPPGSSGGKGSRSIAAALLERLAVFCADGVERFLEDVSAYRKGSKPRLYHVALSIPALLIRQLLAVSRYWVGTVSTPRLLQPSGFEWVV